MRQTLGFSYVHCSIIVVIYVFINVFFFIFLQKAFLTFFNFPNVFFLKKTLNSQCENSGNLEYLHTKIKKNAVLRSANKIIADCVFRFTYF